MQPQSDTSTLILILTYRCNMTCDYCPVDKENETMPWHVAKKALENFLATPAPHKKIRLFGGEPLLEPELVSNIVNLAAPREHVSLDLTTNGTGIDDTIISLLINYPALELIVSIDGPSATNHTHRPGAPNPEQTAALLVPLLASHPLITVNKVVTPKTVSTLAEDFAYITRLGFNRINILPAYYHAPWRAQALKALEIQLDGILEILNLLRETGSPAFIKNLELKGTAPLFNTATVVDTDGAMFSTNAIMHRLIRPHRASFIRGHVRDFTSFRPDPVADSRKISSILTDDEKSSSLAADKILSRFVNRL